jgi:CheY-like chemotaxis protein
VRKRVLVIEDDYHSRFVFTSMLKYRGYETSEAETGEAGLRIAAEAHPHLILLDVGLPGMNGWEVCKHLKSHISTASIKIIIITAHAFLHDEKMAHECGTDLFLAKPLEPTIICKHVARLIGSAQLAT